MTPYRIAFCAKLIICSPCSTRWHRRCGRSHCRTSQCHTARTDTSSRDGDTRLKNAPVVRKRAHNLLWRHSLRVSIYLFHFKSSFRETVMQYGQETLKNISMLKQAIKKPSQNCTCKMWRCRVVPDFYGVGSECTLRRDHFARYESCALSNVNC